MNNLIHSIDTYKRQNNIKTDAQLAQLWGVTRSYICRIRRGERQPGNRIWRAIFKEASLIPEAIKYFQEGKPNGGINP